MRILIAAGDVAAGPLAALDRLHSSFAILLALVAVVAAAGILFKIGLIGFALRVFGAVVRRGVRAGFRVWEVLFSWAPWPVFLALVLGLLVSGWRAAGTAPGVTVAAGFAALVMGVSACLAYMFIDLERYEVGRGYKAVHDPLKGQLLAAHLVRHGGRVGVLLLAAAAVGAVGGFALLNQGLYETVGRAWYAVGDEKESAGYADFLAYSLINLYRIVDVLDTAGTRNLFRVTYVRQAAWPAGLLLTAFKTFFTLVLLQQIFASVRQGQALAESVAEFWSPHPPIQERARNSLPQYGPAVVGPLLESLRAVPALTREQRDQLPRVIAGIGPGSVRTLIDRAGDDHEGVRAVAAGALGLLHALDALPALAELTKDPSDLVREEAVGALGVIGGPGVRTADRRARVSRGGPRRRAWIFGRRGAADAHQPDRVELAVSALRGALADQVAAVRVGAVRSLGLIGPAAAAAVPDLAARLKDADETVRCAAADALGTVGEAAAIPALAAELGDPSPAVRAAAARALGTFGEGARPAVPALIPLLHDADEDVRRAAGDAIGGAGELTNGAAHALAAGLASADTQVQALTAEGLGQIGEGAAAAAPALAAALANGSDRVRAKAAEALGKIGEGAAAAVPTLIRALHDKDNWVSALAAEALGEMGDAGDAAVPALVRSLRHINPLVRANAAEALGKMGTAAAGAAAPLRAAAADADGGVRVQAIKGLGEVAAAGGADTFVAGLRDAEPRVRAAAAETLGKTGAGGDAAAAALLTLLDDANDQVKFQVMGALPRLAGATPDVVAGLCRRLTEDDSPWIRETAAQALGQLGEAAGGAGEALLRAARTGEAGVREQALRSIAVIQPPETADALTGGMTDVEADVRKVASAGWMRAAEIPEAAVPALIEALRDPEVQVRANAAHALSRLDALPAAAVPLLAECATDPNDGLRLNAAVALRKGDAAADVLRRLVDDPNSRVRLIAAGAVLARDPADPAAAAVVSAALSDPALRLRQVGLDVIASLGERGELFRDVLRRREGEEEDRALRGGVVDVLARLGTAPAPDGV